MALLYELSVGNETADFASRLTFIVKQLLLSGVIVIYTAKLEREILFFVFGIRYFDFGWAKRVIAIAVAGRGDYDFFVKLIWLLWSDTGNYTDSHALE